MIELIETNFDIIAIAAISIVVAINAVYTWTLYITWKKRKNNE